MKAFLFPVLFFLFLSSTALSQKKVEFKANSLKFANHLGNGAKRLLGNVQFTHEDVLMFCDSAYFYNDNSLEGFGHVHVQQGDSLHLYGDHLKYSGNTKKAVISKNVLVNKGDMQLTTDVLNYDVPSRVGFYTTPARIVNKENVLTSNQGYYFGKTNDLSFKNNVVLTNPQFVINCDTMRYNTGSKVTYFLGPTTIKSKANVIYCEDGWYDTFKDQSRFSRNAYILTEGQKMFGDSLYYDRKKGIGRAVKNIQIIDTAQDLTIKGNLALHYELKDLSIVTGDALLTQVYEKDTLFLHADTLKALGETGIKKAGKKQETKDVKKANDQHLFAYHKVKFYKKDLQGKCDSLAYFMNDSVMKLFGKPTLWSDENQLSADSISVFTGEKSIKSIELKGTGFIVSKEDSLRYNQIRGKFMKGYFRDNALYQINVEGNGQTIYYAKEDSTIKAVNRADCSDLIVHLKENKIQKITFKTKPDMTLFPIDKIDIKELRLKDFTWRGAQRPLSSYDIFKWN
ncbi:MAG: organic solvent tolerance protein OstA [Bacteroidota bacterium]|nr:organic solvent tolerance protein OstA [Bacteroidota bacterium]